MNEFIAFLNAAGKGFVSVVLPMLIQSSLLIVAVLVLDLLLRRRIKAVVRYGIWLLVLVKLVLPPSLAAPTSLVYWIGAQLPSLPSQIETVIPEPQVAPPAVSMIEQPIAMAEPRFVPPVEQSAPVFDPPSQPATTALEPVVFVSPPPPITWQAMVFLAWLLVVVVMTLLLIQRAFFVRGLIAQSTEAPEAMTDLLDQCRRQMRVRHRVVLRRTSLSASPSVCGLWKPRILMPQSMIAQLDAQQMKSILLHELAHVKRGDLWINLIQALLQIAYFFHPLLWLANLMIRRVREQAVDETVLAAMGDEAEDYPRTLLNISKLAFGRPTLSLRLIGVVESKQALTARIKHIVSRPFPTTAKLGLAGLVLVATVAAILLPMAKAEPRDSKANTIDDKTATVNTDASSETPPEESAESVPDTPQDEIAGVVVDPNGLPMADARVTLGNRALLLPESRQRRSPGRPVIRKPSTRTDEQGQFRFTELRPGTTDITVSAEGCRTETLRNISPGTSRLRVQLGKPHPYTLSGIVVDEAGDPISLAEVFLVETPTYSRRDWAGTFTIMPTALDGRFHFSNTLEPITDNSKKRSLFVSKAGYGIWGKSHPATGAETSVRITLRPQGTISGRAVDADNKPIPNTVVRMRAWMEQDEASAQFLDDWMTFAPQTRTDPNGQFALTGLPADCTVFLRLTAEGYASPELSGIQTRRPDTYADRREDGATDSPVSGIASETPAEFRLQRAVTLRGTVVYEGTNQPAPDLRVTLQGQSNGAWSKDWTDAEGRFEMTDVRPVPCNLMVTPNDPLADTIPDWTVQAISLDDLEPGETREDLRLVLTKGGIVRGRVVDAEGHPLQGIDIGLHSAARPRSSGTIQGTSTGPDGTWAYRLPPGEVYAYIGMRRDDWSWQPESRTVSLRAGQTIDAVDFQLGQTLPLNSPYRAKPVQARSDFVQADAGAETKPTRTIQGIVTDALGRPRECVYVAPQGTRVWDGVMSDAQGRVMLKDVTPDQKVWLAYSQASALYGIFRMSPTTPSEPLRVRLDLNAADLSGRVVGADGKALADREVELVIATADGTRLPWHYRPKTDAFGYYEGEAPCGPGVTIEARVLNTDSDTASFSTGPVKLRAKQGFIEMPLLVAAAKKTQPDFDRNLRDDGMLHCRGRVADENGRPIADVRVHMSFDMPGWMSTWVRDAMTDSQGRWHRAVPPQCMGLSLEFEHAKFYIEDNRITPVSYTHLRAHET